MVGALVLGVQKCGTTTLANWLAQNPGVTFCSQKEPDFFSRNEDWKAKLAEYHQLFSSDTKDNRKKLWIEASTSYSWFLEFPQVADRLFEYNPNLKFIYIVREPISRIVSHYKHNFLKGHTRKVFSEAVIGEPEFLAHSCYETQIRPFLNRFKRENFLFLQFEDLVTKEEDVLNRIFNFLDLEPLSASEQIDMSAQNKSDTLKKVSPLKKYIAPFFRFVPLSLRLKFRTIMYSEHKVEIDSNPQLEEQLYQLLYNDIRAFRDLSGIDYIR
jgi:hypothetical protein